jgi:hypothetical protein
MAIVSDSKKPSAPFFSERSNEILRNAWIKTLSDIELAHRIRKGQFKLGKLRIKDKTAPEIWVAVLAA